MSILLALLAGLAIPLAFGRWSAGDGLADGATGRTRPAQPARSATPIPAPKVRLRPSAGGGESLPAGCTVEGVTAIYTGFIDAFNRGDQAALARFIPPESTFSAVPEPGKFTFLAVAPPGGGGAFHDRAGVLAFAAARHRHHERWALLRLDMSGSWWAGGIDAVLDISREADDVSPRVVGVQGGVDCRAKTISTWGVGDRPMVPDAWFEASPSSTPFG